MDYRKEAKDCVKDRILPLHKHIYAKFDGIVEVTEGGTIVKPILTILELCIYLVFRYILDYIQKWVSKIF